jgi:hypothetical protein
MGPLYAYRAIFEQTEIRPISSGAAKARFAVVNDLDPRIYNGSVTLEFRAPQDAAIVFNGKPLAERAGQATDRWDSEYFRRDGEHLYITVRPGAILEFR